MTKYATLEDLETLWRPLKSGETARAEALLGTVSALLRAEARKRRCDLDARIEADEDLKEAAKSVTCDVVGRALMTSTDQEPMQQTTQSALGYSFSGTYLVPGGGLFIKNSELSRLGIIRQRYGPLEVFDV